MFAAAKVIQLFTSSRVKSTATDVTQQNISTATLFILSSTSHFHIKNKTASALAIIESLSRRFRHEETVQPEPSKNLAKDTP